MPTCPKARAPSGRRCAPRAGRRRSSHLYERPVTSSETWTWLHSPVVHGHASRREGRGGPPLPPGDQPAHRPRLALHGRRRGLPGLALLRGGGVQRQEPLVDRRCRTVPRYLQRLSFLLRQGRPANDVAFYLPNSDAWARFVPGKVGSFIEAMTQRLGPDELPAVLDAGFNLDFSTTAVLAERGRAEEAGSPSARTGTAPSSCPISNGCRRRRCGPSRPRASRACRSSRRGARRRWRPATWPRRPTMPTSRRRPTACSAAAAPAGVFVARDADLAAALRSRLTPDVAVSAGAADIGFVHRRTDAADVYFVANTSNTPQTVDATFRVAATAARQLGRARRIGRARSRCAPRRAGTATRCILTSPRTGRR